MRLCLLALCAWTLAGPLSAADTITGTDLNGDPVRIAYADGPVLLVFWASWCAACRREMPVVKALHSRAGTTVRVVGVSIDEQVADARKAATSSALPYPNLVDPQMVIAEPFAVTHTPMFILLSRDGTELGRGSTLGRLREPLSTLGLSP